MTSRETEIANKITSYLDHATAELKAGTVYRLQLARADALARLVDPQRIVAPELAQVLAGVGRGVAPRPTTRMSLRVWLGIAIFAVVAGLGWQQWRAFQDVKDFEELDAQILSSDLPIDAYLDRGFQNWLKASFER
ncbi:MAG TPA: DUF3619 family protein [Casimicrobiaceae bacterium]|jgi:hypothetical protein